MARYKVILAYDGTGFLGSQRQAVGRTVQAVFEDSLRKLGWSDQSITLAGRTDKGVHASGQVVAFDLNWNHPTDDLLQALNALLPRDMAVRSITPCANDFHPRFDAVERTYRYEIFCDPTRDPLRERYAWRVWPIPELELMKAVSNLLVGTHDYGAFGGPTRSNGSTIRNIRQNGWQQQKERLTFVVTANGFLYHMVRRMVFVQVSYGQGKLDPGYISQVFEPPPGQMMFQGLAPAQGLNLVEVCYPSG